MKTVFYEKNFLLHKPDFHVILAYISTAERNDVSILARIFFSSKFVVTARTGRCDTRRDTSFFIILAAWCVVLHPRAEIRASFFIYTSRYVVLHPRGMIHRSSSSRRDTFFFRSAAIYSDRFYSRGRKKSTAGDKCLKRPTAAGVFSLLFLEKLSIIVKKVWPSKIAFIVTK